MTKFKEISKNSIFYNYFVENKIVSKRNLLSTKELLNRISFVAEFAYFHNPGLFYDYRLESILLEIGNEINDNDFFIQNRFSNLFLDDKKENNILHVASIIADVGGHTRILSQMLSRIVDKNQVLILTLMQKDSLPQWFTEKHKDIVILTLESANGNIEKATILRELSFNFGCVILYHHPYDVIPTLAFANKNCPPILLENHAHSWFWLGYSIADLVFSHSKFHVDFTQKFRDIKRNFFLPLTQLDKSISEINTYDKLLAKQRINISSDKICITVIGTSQKFYPISKQYNIFRLIQRITIENPEVIFIVIGLNYDSKIFKKYKYSEDNVRFIGYMQDLTDYYLASDINIDSIPEPSLGASMYAIWYGLACPLFKYGGSGVFDVAQIMPNDLYQKEIGKTNNENEFLDKLNHLIKNKSKREKIAFSYNSTFNEYANDILIQQKIEHLLLKASKIKHQLYIKNKNIIADNEYSEEIAYTNKINIKNAHKYFQNHFSTKDYLCLSLLFYKNLYLVVLILFYTIRFFAKRVKIIIKKHIYS